MSSLQGRTEMSEEITKVGNQNTDLDWLISESEADESLAALAEHRVLPRTKVIQALTRSELKDRFDEGAVVLMPGEVQIAPKKGSFLFVPVFFYGEFGCMSDQDDPDSDMFFEKSFDEESELARKARDKDLRVQKYGPDDCYEMKNVEILNFPGFIYGDHNLAGTPMTISFMRGEFMTGKTWTGSLMLRKISGHAVPLWAQVWKFTSTFHDLGPKKKWWGITPTNPEGEEPLYIKSSERDTFHGAHLEFARLYKDSLLSTDHEAGETVSKEEREAKAAGSEI